MSGVTYLSPNEPWPSHPRPEARAALKEAAAAGWYFRKLSNHAFGMIKCAAMGDPGACSLQVFSTSGPFDGSETAKVIRRKLRACPHQALPDEAEVLPDQSDEDLERCVRALLQAAAGLDARARAAEAIDVAIEHDDVDALDAQEDARVRGDNRAQVAWAQLGRPVEPWPPAVGVEALLAEAENLTSMVTNEKAAARLLDLIEQTRP